MHPAWAAIQSHNLEFIIRAISAIFFDRSTLLAVTTMGLKEVIGKSMEVG
jgi:hypothetical protein